MTTRSHGSFWRPILATVASAGLFALAFPPTAVRPVAYVALVPFFLALRGRSLRAAIGLGWLWGMLAAYSIGVWFAPSISTYFLQPQWVGIALFAGVATSMVAPYTLAFAILHRGLERRDARVVPLCVAAAWCATELLRGRLFTGTPFFIGNPWGLIGYSQVGISSLVQVASITGIYGVSFVVVAVNAALAQGWTALRCPAASRPRNWLSGCAFALAVLPAVALHGLLALGEAPSDEAAPEGHPIALVQGNVAIGSQWRSDAYGRHLDLYLELSREALAFGPTDSVFWPESSMTFFLDEEPLYRRSLASLLAHHDAELVAGGPRREQGPETRYFNTVWQLSPQGQIVGHYDKQYLLPISEYPPLQRFDLFRRSFEGVRFFTPGGMAALLGTRPGAAGVLVCNEVMLPEVASRRVFEGAEYLLNPSNDTWISHPQYVEQQFQIARMRAVEQRRFLVRSSTAGPSAIIDPWGRVQDRTGSLVSAWIRGHVLPRSERTIYSRWGDWFGATCGLVAVAATLARRRSSCAEKRAAASTGCVGVAATHPPERVAP